MSVFDNWENGRANAEEEIIQLRKCAEEDAKALDLQEAEVAKAPKKRKRISRKAYRSAYAEAAEACGLVKVRVNGKVFWE